MEKHGNVLMQKYEFGKLLGQGTFAKVYHARNIETGQSVAIKVIDKEKVLKVGLINQTKREISVMGLIKHPNVVELYEVMATRTKIYLSMEYAKGGELFHRIAKGKLNESTARSYFQQLIGAVDFSHRRGIFHRDLKLENLLLDEHGRLKITDFGLCAMAESKRQDGLLHTTCGTPAYVAPEVISRKGYDGVKADIWSCGVILFVLLAGFLPFQDANVMNMYRLISKAQYKIPGWFPPDVRRLLSRILDPNPRTRISISKIMKNHWFQKGAISKCSNTSVELKEKGKPELAKLNAFDIISLSSGFDLSGLFNKEKKEVKFTSKEPASEIVQKLEEIARNVGLGISRKDEGVLKMESGGFRIDAEVFEFSPSFLLVEVKTSGDELEFQKMMKRDFRPALEGMVWAWQA